MRGAGWVVALSLAASFAVAGGDEESELLAPLTLEDLTMRSLVGLRVPVLFGRLDYWQNEIHLWALSPRVHAQVGLGRFAVGASFAASALWMASPDLDGYWFDPGDRGDWRPGNPTAYFSFRHCFSAARGCTGVVAAVSVASDRIHRIYGRASPSSWFEIEDNAHFGAMSVHQDTMVSAVDHLVMRTTLVYAQQVQGLGFQFELGPMLHLPISNQDFWQKTQHESVEVAIRLGVGIGYQVLDWLVVLADLRSEHPVTTAYLLGPYNLFWFNLGCRFDLQPFYPSLRLGFPLNEEARLGWSDFEVQLEVGLVVVL